MFGSAALPAPSSFAGQQAVQGVDLSKEPTAASPTATGWSRGNKPVKSSEGGRCSQFTVQLVPLEVDAQQLFHGYQPCSKDSQRCGALCPKELVQAGASAESG